MPLKVLHGLCGPLQLPLLPQPSVPTAPTTVVFLSQDSSTPLATAI